MKRIIFGTERLNENYSRLGTCINIQLYYTIGSSIKWLLKNQEATLGTVNFGVFYPVATKLPPHDISLNFSENYVPDLGWTHGSSL